MTIKSTSVGLKPPEVTHHVDARWLMAYAASVGDLLPCYMNTQDNTVLGHPLFPVCVEWPAILKTPLQIDPGDQVTWVDASHDLHVYRLIQDGDVLTTRGEIIGMEQRNPGVFSVARYETRDQHEQLVAMTFQGSMSLHGKIDGHNIPARLPPMPGPTEFSNDPVCLPLSIPAGAAHIYGECARIWNPIHTDLAVALAAGLPGVFLHGTAILAMSVSAIVRQFSGGNPRPVRRVAGRFSGMVPTPAELTIRVQSEEGAANRRHNVFFEVENEQGRPVLSDGLVSLSDDTEAVIRDSTPLRSELAARELPEPTG